MNVHAIIPDWPVPPQVRAISTLRSGGVSTENYTSLNLGAHVGDRPDRVAENRHRLREQFRLPDEPAWLTQVHGVAVADLDARNPVLEADAAVTRAPHRICAILTADCLPVLFADRAGTCVAAAHAGWRGLLGGVLEETVRAMPAAASDVIAWLGPAIGPRKFEVGGEVRTQFLARDEQADPAFHPTASGKFLADLFWLARRRLHGAGVTQLHGGGECTFADPARFFSHRRDQLTGRQATLVWLTSA